MPSHVRAVKPPVGIEQTLESCNDLSVAPGLLHEQAARGCIQDFVSFDGLPRLQRIMIHDLRRQHEQTGLWEPSLEGKHKLQRAKSASNDMYFALHVEQVESRKLPRARPSIPC